MNISYFRCHLQAVERHIKLLTKASATVCGQEARDGFIRTKIESRDKLPKFDTKQQFFNSVTQPKDDI